MPPNHRVAKVMKTYNLRLEPSEYEKVQKAAFNMGIPMNTLLQHIIKEYNPREKSEIIKLKITTKLD